MTQTKEPVTIDAIHTRLARIYAAIKQTAPTELKESNINQSWETSPSGEFRAWHMDFQFDRSEAELFNVAMMAINNIAVFRAYCIPYGMEKGIAKEEVKGVVENCKALQIINDLHNTEKHPVTPSNMSGQSPRLKSVTQAPYLVEGKGKIEFDIIARTTTIIGEVSVVIAGTVINSETGDEIGQLGKLLDEGITAWETFLKAHNIV